MKWCRDRLFASPTSIHWTLALFIAVLVASTASASSSAMGGTIDDLELVTVTTDVGGVVAITHAGDSRLFVSTQDGFIQIFDGEEVLPTPFLDISGVVGSGFEGGLLSAAFHPDYASNGYFYVYYSAPDLAATVARYEVMAADPDRADPSSGVVLMDIPHFGGHYGGQLHFGPDGYLYFTIGDGGEQMDPECRAQTPELLQGKMLRLDVDQNADTEPYYGIPPTNPFIGGGPPADEVWAIGFRNPWRFSFDRQTGDLLISDVGQFQREEVNFQPAGSAGGQNYGWKVMEGTSCFDPDPIDEDCPPQTASCFDPSYTMPVLEYDHSGGECSITGGYVYRGSASASLQGRYLYGDWCSGALWAASRSGDVWTPELLPFTLSAIRTFGEAADGEIYLSDGQALYRIEGDGSIFVSGFETGDLTEWSSSSF